MVRDILDSALLPQEEMAAKLKVSQQAISNWLNARRNPSPETIPALLKMAQDAGLDIGMYEPNSEFGRITEYMRKNEGRELVRSFELYSRMTVANRKRFMKYAERMSLKR